MLKAEKYVKNATEIARLEEELKKANTDGYHPGWYLGHIEGEPRLLYINLRGEVDIAVDLSRNASNRIIREELLKFNQNRYQIISKLEDSDFGL